MADHEQPMPPMVKLDDPGVTWRREAEGLIVERKPTARAVLGPLAAVLLFGGFGGLELQQGRMLGASLLLLVALLVAVALVVAATLRIRIVATSTGLGWERTGPRAGKGRAGAITGARVHVGRQPVRWGAHRTITLEVRVHGRWHPLAYGKSQARAEDLARAMREALGLAEEAAVGDSS